MKEKKIRGSFYFIEGGDIVLEWRGNSRTFGSVSQCVNFCRENNIEAYPETL